MASHAVGRVLTNNSPFVQCAHCQQKLPLRVAGSSEQSAASWKCANCSKSVLGYCETALLLRNSHTVSLDDPYFDVSNSPEIDLQQRRTVAKMAERKPTGYQSDRRRSPRIPQSLVAPAICLTSGLMPFGTPFRVMVANLSREGAGLVNEGRIKADYIAMLLKPEPERAVQVIVRIVRHLQLEGPYYEIGGEFHLRLGSKSDA